MILTTFVGNSHFYTAKSLQSCLTLCDPTDGSPPGSPFPGILQARTLEWVAISFSKAWKWKVKVKSLSRVRLFTTPWTAAYQALPSIGFSRQEYLPSTNEKVRAPRAPKSNSAAYKWQGKSLTSLSQAQIQCFFYYTKQSNNSIFQFLPMNSGVTGKKKRPKKKKSQRFSLS